MELAVIMAVIAQSGAIADVTQRLLPDMFTNPSYRLVYRAMTALYDHEADIDILSIEEEMRLLDPTRAGIYCRPDADRSQRGTYPYLCRLGDPLLGVAPPLCGHAGAYVEGARPGSRCGVAPGRHPQRGAEAGRLFRRKQYHPRGRRREPAGTGRTSFDGENDTTFISVNN